MSHRFRVAALFVSVLLAPTAFAGTRFVNVALATGANDGSSWADAYRTADGVSIALAASIAGDEVWVAAGTYLPTTAGTRATAIGLKNGVAVLGGFNGTEVSASQRDAELNVTILSGDLAGNDGSSIFTDNSFHVLTGAGTNATAVIDGFVVRGGNANGGAANQDRGGGILCVGGASPTVRNCNFVANRCSFGGGAGYINGSSPSFTDCVFDGNNGANFGGAFDMASNVQATFERCVFRNNTAARAGAIEIFGSSPVKVWSCLFHDNTSTGTGGGGAIFVSSSTPQIRNCTIVFNSATANATGGILGLGGTVINCVVYGNTGSGGSSGQAAQLAPATMNVTYSLTSTGFTGTGNLTATPLFDACDPLLYRLSTGSPGIDAGNNAGVPAAVLKDLAGSPRFGDATLVPDTGAGTSPIVDMGAFESSDCNGNSVADWCDIDAGTSLDLDGNGLPDECECQGGVAPTSYCTPKLNSQFCLPSVGFDGFASASNLGPFTISASDVLNNKTGLMFYGYAAQSLAFQGGTLCITAPLRRTSIMNSGGTPTGTDCTGTYLFDFNAYIQTGNDPMIQVVGQFVAAQFWSRDPQDAFTTSLTDAVQFRICQ